MSQRILGAYTNQFDIRILARYFIALDVVGVAQLVERQVVALVVAGSNPVSHPC